MEAMSPTLLHSLLTPSRVENHGGVPVVQDGAILAARQAKRAIQHDARRLSLPLI